MPVSIIFCYAHEDEDLLKKLKTHLTPLLQQGLITLWHDRDINAGTEWEPEIKKHLSEAQIILLMVSSDFMASEYCYGVEMQRALERHERGEARVIPIILRPVYWQGALGKLQALPTDARPVISSGWHNLDEAVFNVAEGIREVVRRFPVNPSIKLPEPSSENPSVKLPESPSVPQFDTLARRAVVAYRHVPTTPPLDDPTDRVVVVAAKRALADYLNYSIYFCQPNRVFRDCIRLAFYTDNRIYRKVPKILGQIEAISQKEIETREDLEDWKRVRLQNLLNSLDRQKSEEWSGQWKVTFLSSCDSPETLILPHDVVNNSTSGSGQRIAFTQGQRYVSLSRLEKEPATTSELE